MMLCHHIKGDNMEKYLCELLRDWCKSNGYEFKSADELLNELIDCECDYAVEWLETYIKLWDLTVQ